MRNITVKQLRLARIKQQNEALVFVELRRKPAHYIAYIISSAFHFSRELVFCALALLAMEED